MGNIAPLPMPNLVMSKSGASNKIGNMVCSWILYGYYILCWKLIFQMCRCIYNYKFLADICLLQSTQQALQRGSFCSGHIPKSTRVIPYEPIPHRRDHGNYMETTKCGNEMQQKPQKNLVQPSIIINIINLRTRKSCQTTPCRSARRWKDKNNGSYGTPLLDFPLSIYFGVPPWLWKPYGFIWAKKLWISRIVGIVDSENQPVGNLEVPFQQFRDSGCQVKFVIFQRYVQTVYFWWWSCWLKSTFEISNLWCRRCWSQVTCPDPSSPPAGYEKANASFGAWLVVTQLILQSFQVMMFIDFLSLLSREMMVTNLEHVQKKTRMAWVWNSWMVSMG